MSFSARYLFDSYFLCLPFSFNDIIWKCFNSINIRKMLDLTDSELPFEVIPKWKHFAWFGGLIFSDYHIEFASWSNVYDVSVIKICAQFYWKQADQERLIHLRELFLMRQL